ncbi:tRNA lysidine(34) synthetase TilS [Antrihabitans cavernicola]|uniref:tRNA(Ile)-lysidine synthase n=1 Tax=Antrihabitans cavernicola TaxID=2495913 RepID=A0A5A7SG29_9NOCA|nr:tRNA lysidine(34) synthetase TilS [Spelaeibacter cavernicola]KAA0024399.1 tRNA lysidine(34) synthetase TilS [Spelaeibacter cavernicola]
MRPETPHILAVRHAVRDWLDRFPHDRLAVALSGGADSLALTAAAVAEAQSVRALVVDHRLQEGSAAVARSAAQCALELGCIEAEVLTVSVGTVGGMEAAARRARYDALDTARAGMPVLLGHTLDDQAETVLLGLSRGSGGRSIQGMRDYDDPWGRPLLKVRRDTTHRACVDLGVQPHQDPHNERSEFTRVRLRAEVLPLLDDVLGGGVAAALARTGEQLREDGDVLDHLAHQLAESAAVDDQLDVAVLQSAPPALRRRAIRVWLLRGGATSLTAEHLYGIDRLVSHWRGQGGVAVPGGTPEARLVTSRSRGRLILGLQVDDRYVDSREID